MLAASCSCGTGLASPSHAAVLLTFATLCLRPLRPHLRCALCAQVREADKAYREARSAVRGAEKLLLDPPPTDKLLLHVSWGRGLA